MRCKRALLLVCVLLTAVLPLARAAWADFGTAPAWSPDWGSQPIAPSWDPSSAIDVTGVSYVTKDMITAPPPPAGIPSGYGNAFPIQLDNNLPVVTMPLISGDSTYAMPRAMAAMPPITLVETPYDGSMKAIEVPNGDMVLADGTVVSVGTGVGTSGTGTIFTPPDPPALPENWDNSGSTGKGIPSFNAPMLPGP